MFEQVRAAQTVAVNIIYVHCNYFSDAIHTVELQLELKFDS